METKLILGISGSPRKGANTDICLEAAMKAAAEVPGIRTETIYLRDYKIEHCLGCFACCPKDAPPGFENEFACPARKNDDMKLIYPKLLECSGLILGSPVYFGSISGQMKTFMDRTEPLLRYGCGKYQYGLQHKVGGALAVGGNRNAGEEFTIMCMHYYFMVHDMIVVGSGGQPTPGCYLGGGATTWPNDKSVTRDGVTKDELGLMSCRNLGRNVAETVIRTGI